MYHIYIFIHETYIYVCIYTFRYLSAYLHIFVYVRELKCNICLYIFSYVYLFTCYQKS